MTRKRVPDELYGRLNRKFDELKLRIDLERVPLQRAINDIQCLIDGKTFQVHIIDCDADPCLFLPGNWEVESHKKGGQLEWDQTKAQLYLSEKQKNGKGIKGNELRKELENEPVLNANVLDYLFQHPGLIPDDWTCRFIFFWGTIYRLSNMPQSHLYVRYLYWSGVRCSCSYRCLDDVFSDGYSAVFPKSV